MRYAIFTDIHANLEALEAVLAKIDQIAEEHPIDQIWFLGDLVGYGPNPNECIDKLHARANVIIAGNHDWATVKKIDLEDFSEAARISAEWTAEQLTEEHRTFLTNLPEYLEVDDFTLVHGSPFGPLWEYLTSEVLAERSFQHFSTRYCIVGHTHVPVIFQQQDIVANAPTAPLNLTATDKTIEQSHQLAPEQDANEEMPSQVDNPKTDFLNNDAPTAEPSTATDKDKHAEQEQTTEEDSDNTAHLSVVQRFIQKTEQSEGTSLETGTFEEQVADAIDVITDLQYQRADDFSPTHQPGEQDEAPVTEEVETISESITPEETIKNAEERLNEEIEELLSLLGLSQSMINVTNEMILPPEGLWQPPTGYRAIVNPGGVGQPRDGDPRAAFMIYDSEQGFTFYRVPYAYKKTQEKIIKAKLPSYLATRLTYGR
jgi:diadenosine tetraphosphatase ApaH/serine/threonine PP2A family protein phosphatase